jgi:hypothetical protein
VVRSVRVSDISEQNLVPSIQCNLVIWFFLCWCWASNPKVVGSIPTVAGHIFQACLYTQSNIRNIIFTWIHSVRCFLWLKQVRHPDINHHVISQTHW